jgi:hypothetical protein
MSSIAYTEGFYYVQESGGEYSGIQRRYYCFVRKLYGEILRQILNIGENQAMKPALVEKRTGGRFPTLGDACNQEDENQGECVFNFL